MRVIEIVRTGSATACPIDYLQMTRSRGGSQAVLEGQLTAKTET